MSKYTTEVRFICEQYYGLDESKGYDDVDTIITNAANRIFENFPIFDEAYRLPLEKKILRHYYTREICAETVGLWKLWLNNRMNEIMPYYNMLYSSALLEFDPMHDIDYTVNHTGNDSSNEGLEVTSEESGNVSYTKDTKTTTDDDATKTYNTQVANNETNTRTLNTKDTEGGTTERVYNTTESETGDITRTDNLTRNLTGNSTLNRDTESNSTTDTTDNTDTSGTTWEYFNDTPQGGVDRIDVTGLSNYLTSAKKTTNTSETDETIHSVNATTGSEDATSTNTEAETNTGTVKEDRDLDRTHTGSVTDEIDKTLDRTGTITDSKTGTSATTGTVGDNRDVSTVEHGTNVGETEKSSTSNSSKAITSTNAYVERITGKRNSLSYSELLIKFRQTFLNIDAMIIDELQDLFFNLW